MGNTQQKYKGIIGAHITPLTNLGFPAEKTARSTSAYYYTFSRGQFISTAVLLALWSASRTACSANTPEGECETLCVHGCHCVALEFRLDTVCLRHCVSEEDSLVCSFSFSRGLSLALENFDKIAPKYLGMNEIICQIFIKVQNEDAYLSVPKDFEYRGSLIRVMRKVLYLESFLNNNIYMYLYNWHNYIYIKII